MHMMWPERRGHLYDGAASAGWRAIRPDNHSPETTDNQKSTSCEEALLM